MKILAMFKRRWVLSLLGLLAVAVLIWFVGPLLGIAGREPLASGTARIVAILLVALGFSLEAARRGWQGRQASAALAEQVSGATAPAAAAGDTDTARAEVAELGRRLREALELLQQSRRKRGGQALHELPWYIIIGPPGSGKTTALVNSGLRFPLADRFGHESLRGVGGTRNCDWWFTDEAVLLDTAGRYTTQDSDAAADSAAWTGFLALLKKHRKRRPINGVVVTMSIADLMLQGSAEREAHARAVRQRIRELREQLGIRFPIYLAFTKLDLVAGFVEFFDDLSKDGRSQVWGVTFPLSAGAGEIGSALGAEFDALVRRLNDRLLDRLYYERDVQRRALIFGFPQQVAALKETILTFVAGVFQPSAYEEPVTPRGIYLTSGTQEGTPIDRVIAGIARNLGFDQRRLPAFGGPGRAYFITDLLQRVMFPEAGLAGADRRFERQRRWLRRLAYGGAVVVTLGTLALWSNSYLRNQAYVQAVNEGIHVYEQLAEAPITPDAEFDDVLPRLDALRALAEQADAPRREGGLHTGFGLSQAGKLGRGAQAAYARELQALFLPPVAAVLEEQLRQSTDDTDLQYETLKTYLMLGQPRRLERSRLELWMKLLWQQRLAADAEKRERLEAHLASLLDAGFQPYTLDAELVARVRARLTQRPLADLVYGRVKREHELSGNPPFRLADELGPEGSRVFVRASGAGLDQGLPALFTYRGYFEGFRAESARLTEEVRGERWVLGAANDSISKAELEQLEGELNRLYMAEYIRLWDGLLNDLRIVPLRTVQQGAEVARILSGPDSPLRALLQAVERNTSLTRLPGGQEAPAAAAPGTVTGRLSRLLSGPGGEATAAASEPPGARVEKHFEAVNQLVRAPAGATAPVDRVLSLLAELYGYLSGLAQGSGGRALDAAKQGGADILDRLRVDASRQPEPLSNWLLALADGARAGTAGGARAQLNAEFTAGVLPVCRKALDNRYPVFRDGKEEVTLQDFGRVFGPGGLLDGFFQKQLLPFVDTSHTNWRWQSGSVGLGIPDAVLAQFQRAAAIRDTFFPRGGAQPSVEFVLKPLRLDTRANQFLLDLEGQSFSYRHGPTRISSGKWPGPEGPGQVRVVFDDTDGRQHSISEDGPWAWFRILDRSRLTPVSADRFNVVFAVAGLAAEYEIRASSVLNPFLMRELHEFRCPAGL